MALFKPFRENRAALDSKEKHDGYAYFCTDDGTFHIDYMDENGELQRKQLNAKDTETLLGATLVNELTNSENQIPTTKAVTNALELKVDKSDLVQSDWDEIDENSLAFIKNKPDIATDKDALKLLGELNVVVPVTTLNNQIITDSTDRIYIL